MITDSTAPMSQLLAATTALQRRAADPAASAWVSANAGTGKTHVLTQRVLRLLLSGTPPARILCLTYTKAAAAEMSTRVFETLAGWVGLPQRDLEAALEKLAGVRPDASTLALARTLFTTAIETPGGFKVQTIHAFAERLLQRFPLEAAVPPAFQILDEHGAKSLMSEAIDDTLRAATADRDAPLGRALMTAIRYAADETFDTVLLEAVASREALEAIVVAGESEDADDPFGWLDRQLRAAFGVPAGVSAEDIQRDLCEVLDQATIGQLVGVLAAGGPKDRKAADWLRLAFGAGEGDRIAALRRFFLNKKGDPRDRVMTKPSEQAHPELYAIATRAQEAFRRLEDALTALDVTAATVALHRLAQEVQQRFTAGKAARAALDFDDLISRTAALLATRENAAWVLYKLDGGIDHVLVDEAQDTSPSQWRIVGGIVEEFFGDTGAGGVLRERPRTVFAVGDEKQSIYSFQGAAPEMFAQQGRRFEAMARHSGQTWNPAALTLSFRTVAPILSCVDLTFADPTLTPGVRAGGGMDGGRHQVKRVGEAGVVEIWPLEVPEPAAAADAWSPLDEEGSAAPVVRLARRIAVTIKGWLDSGERLESEGRAIRPGDILVLVRKRAPVAPAVVAALKALDVPVAGSDRIKLTEQIAVQDLMALGDFLTLPEDDLALANVLKSPLFGLDDDDLLALAHGRRGTLWKSLLDAAGAGAGSSARAAVGFAAEQLKRWRKQADFLPPFEFFAQVLDRDGGRMKILKRLGPEAADAIDEFMNLAIQFDDAEPPSLTGFLCWLREDERTIKRDMEQGRDEVRVLTVHGAKGLEAPIVFLPDTCANAAGGRKSMLVELEGAPLPAGTPPIPVWAVKGASRLDAIAAARAARRSAEGEELNRLLYVALTRPRDRLYVAGFIGEKAMPLGCWYDVLSTALDGHLVPVVDADGRRVLRLTSAQTEPPSAPKRIAGLDVGAAARPPWMTAAAPREPVPVIPFAPSRLAPYDHDESGEPAAAATRQVPAVAERDPAEARLAAGDDARFLRGSLTHALLEHLPGRPAETWRAVAEGFLARRGEGLPARVQAGMVEEIVGLLNDPTFGALFASGSRAEVPIVAELPDPSGRSLPLRLNGQIDRLAVTPVEVLIVDYKTNRVPPIDVAGVPLAYLVQLAAYRAALADIYPGRRLRAALLWTAAPRLMEIPAALLDGYGARLWELATATLDLEGPAP